MSETAYLVPTNAHAPAKVAPCVLDHSLFPHVMDEVIATAPPESHIALRACSREFRDRVDPLLFNHVVIAPGDESGFLSVSASGGRFHLRIVGDCDKLVSHRDRVVHPALPPLLEHTRVVSLRGPVDQYAGSLAWFSPNLKRVEVLRILPPMPRPFTIWPDTVRGAKKLIAFTCMSRGSLRTLQSGATVYHPPVAMIPPVPLSVRQLVLNVSVHPDDPWHADSTIQALMPPSTVKNIVVIFVSALPPDVTPNLGMSNLTLGVTARSRLSHSAQPLGILTPIIRLMIMNPETKVTVVSAECLGAAPFGFDQSILPSEIEGTIKSIAADILKDEGWGNADDPAKNLTLMSLGEYRKTADPQQFVLETEE